MTPDDVADERDVLDGAEEEILEKLYGLEER